MTDTPPPVPDFEKEVREFCDLMPHEKIHPNSYASRVQAILRSAFAAGSASRSGDYERGFREAVKRAAEVAELEDAWSHVTKEIRALTPRKP